MSRPATALARALLRLGEVHPDPYGGSLGEAFNLREFQQGTPEFRHAFRLRISGARFQSEALVSYASYFPGVDIAPYLRDRRVLDFGSSTAGLARAIVEKYAPRALFGVEIDAERVAAARDAFRALGWPVRFVRGDGQRLPFPDAAFDTIYSFDVLEHVPDPGAGLKECARVLRPGGHMLLVFPGYYHPTEHHLSLVSQTPFVHYFFGPRTLSEAYHSLLAERGEDAYWYRRESPSFHPWERSYSINGLTRARSLRLMREAGLQMEHDCAPALGETGMLRRRFPVLRIVTGIARLLSRLPILDEVFAHRVAVVLKKPA